MKKSTFKKKAKLTTELIENLQSSLNDNIRIVHKEKKNNDKTKTKKKKSFNRSS